MSVNIFTPNTQSCEIYKVVIHTDIRCQMILVGGVNQKNINYVYNQRGNPYSNIYNPGWRDHSNSCYKNNSLRFVENPPQQALGPPGF